MKRNIHTRTIIKPREGIGGIKADNFYSTENRNMKLEIKHLAPYLPYDLKFIFENKTNHDKFAKTGTELPLTPADLYFLDDDDFGIKPLLHPLSDLTKEVIIMDVCDSYWNHIYIANKAHASQWDVICDCMDAENIQYQHYWVIEFLLSHHFDVFGLIEQGLAIEIK